MGSLERGDIMKWEMSLMPGTEERPEQEPSGVNISRLVSLCLSKSTYLA